MSDEYYGCVQCEHTRIIIFMNKRDLLIGND